MSEINKLDWKEYESITKYIYETLGKEFGVKIEGYGNEFKVTGQSGVKHQIDVLTSNTDGKNTYRTAIECKFWKNKITKDTVMKVSKIIEDAGIDKGIIVTKSGYTKDALDFANHCNIGLVTLRERGNDNAENEPESIAFGLLEIRQHVTIHRPEILSIALEYVDMPNTSLEPINRYNHSIRLSNEKEIPLNNLATAFQEALQKKRKIFQIFKQRHEFLGGSLIDNINRSSVRIDGLTFTGILKKIESNSNIEFTLTDQVWLIMKSIFEERSFTILESGLIVENTN